MEGCGGSWRSMANRLSSSLILNVCLLRPNTNLQEMEVIPSWTVLPYCKETVSRKFRYTMIVKEPSVCPD